MSNVTLKARIARALAEFEAGRLNLADLRRAVVENGKALEAMPYPMIREIHDFEHALTELQWSDEEGCEANPQEVLNAVKQWLTRIPEEL